MKPIRSAFMDQIPVALVLGNLKTKIIGDGTTMIIERTSPFVDDVDFLSEIIKSNPKATPEIKSYIVVSPKVFDITDSLEIFSIETKQTE